MVRSAVVALVATTIGSAPAAAVAAGLRVDAAGTCSLPVPLDHGDAESPTFTLRCFYNAEHWQGPTSGAPIYIIPGGEAPIWPPSVTSLYPAHSAQLRGALVVSTEHRMFGDSMPPRRLANDMLPFLTVEQAIQDLVHLVADVRAYFNATAANSVVVWGCSYAGLLASLLKETTDGVVVAAVAGNAPLQATDDFQSYGTVLHAALANSSAACAAQTVATIANVSASLLSPSKSARRWVTQTFGACGPIDTRLDALTFLNMYGWLDPLYPVLQSGPAHVDPFCDAVTKDGAVGALVSYTQRKGVGCSPSSFQTWVATFGPHTSASPTDTGRAFLWLLCSSLGYSVTGTGAGGAASVAPPDIDSQWYGEYCAAAFGGVSPTPPTLSGAVRGFNRRYGGQRPNNTRTVYVVGDVDPWSSLAPSATEVPAESCRVGYFGGHCAWWLLPKAGDAPSVGTARASIEKALDGYLSPAIGS